MELTPDLTLTLIQESQCWGPQQDNIYNTDSFPISPYSENLVEAYLKEENNSTVNLNKVWNTMCPGSDVAFASKQDKQLKGIQVKANVYYPEKPLLASNMFRNWNKKDEWKMDYSLSMAFEAPVTGTADPFKVGSLPTACLLLTRDDFYNGILDHYREVRISYNINAQQSWKDKPHIDFLREHTWYDFDELIKYMGTL